MSRAPGHLPILGLWLLAAGLVIRMSVGIIAFLDQPANGFVAHYTASRLLLEGGDAAALYDDSVFVPAVRRYEPGVADIFGANPPTVAIAATPVAALDYRSARTVWTLASLIAWLFSVWWLTRVLALGGVWAPGLVAVAALFQPAAENLRHGQFHVFVLVLVLIAWQGVRRRRPSTVGKGLGVALATKAAGMVFWPLLLVQRSWRALAWAAGTFAAFAVLSVVLLGVDAWHLFIERAGDTAAAGSLSVTAYQTLPGLVRRLTVVDARWNPFPAFDLGGGGLLLSGLVVSAVLLHSLVVSHRVTDSRAFAAFAALGLAISPVSLDYHYVLAIFPAAMLLALHRDRLRSVSGLLTLAAIAMIGLDLPYRSARLADGWIAVLAYPKLYGALILWWLLLRPDGAHRIRAALPHEVEDNVEAAA